MRGLSQEQLALASGITTTYLGLLERNLKNPTIKVIEQICNALQISLQDFSMRQFRISPVIQLRFRFNIYSHPVMKKKRKSF